MSKQKILIIVILVVILVIILLYVFRDNVFASTPKVTSINNNTGTNSIFPLKVGSYNLPEVGRLQTYLKSKGATGCNGSILIIDNDFGPNTECATKQILGTVQVTQAQFNSLGI